MDSYKCGDEKATLGPGEGSADLVLVFPRAILPAPTAQHHTRLRWHAAGRAVDAIGLWVTMIASRDHRVPLLRLNNEIEMNTSATSRLPPKATPRPVFFSSKGMKMLNLPKRPQDPLHGPLMD
ncbi:hypothetical protein I7I51_07837 [Histoplasma capsulatum]|uniref:Uncharacterized protein n=1 Tax=Ajellomyces capsulatus TaxID=5037 RepID=A0A8A1LXA5_AJECA|nr:hypothetical protein I7I51_07837 [Histoplasma capsulatum]